MTTHYPADPCSKPYPIAETIRERLQCVMLLRQCVLLRKALPWLVNLEVSVLNENAELLDLIRQIETVTANTPSPVNYQPDDYERVESDYRQQEVW